MKKKKTTLGSMKGCFSDSIPALLQPFWGLLRLAHSESEPNYIRNVNKFVFSAVFPAHLEGKGSTGSDASRIRRQ